MEGGEWERIRVWSDPWIPNTQSRRVLSPRGNSNFNLKVGELINPITSSWKVEEVN